MWRSIQIYKDVESGVLEIGISGQRSAILVTSLASLFDTKSYAYITW